ncbi:Motile sperm domain-containing protein 2 [Entomortierella beljakovae]|nr:Motile sperm domain-containing protein 2 [Entomortierella beljakovae]
MSSISTQGSTGSNPVPALLRISPQTFQFTASRVSSGLVSKLKIKNLLQSPVGYKFKTNAPLRYSVKPVLGVLAPGQSIEVFVRCENWVNPQDRFLLQSVPLSEEESEQIDATTWKEIDRRRIMEAFIHCTSSSSLSLGDIRDDLGSLSSSSITSSTTSSVVSSAYSEKNRQLRQNQQKPIVAHVHAAGRKMSTGSNTSTNSSPGNYPTLFSSKNGTTSSNLKGKHTSSSSGKNSKELTSAGLFSIILSYLATKLSNSKQTIKTLSRFLAVRQYTKMQVFTVSVVCLLLGLLMPLEKIFFVLGGNPNPTPSNTQFRTGVLTGSKVSMFSAAI